MTKDITTQPRAGSQPRTTEIDSYEEYMVEVCCDICAEWCVPGMCLMLGAAISYWYTNGTHYD